MAHRSNTAKKGFSNRSGIHVIKYSIMIVIGITGTLGAGKGTGWNI